MSKKPKKRRIDKKKLYAKLSAFAKWKNAATNGGDLEMTDAVRGIRALLGLAKVRGHTRGHNNGRRGN